MKHRASIIAACFLSLVALDNLRVYAASTDDPSAPPASVPSEPTPAEAIEAAAPVEPTVEPTVELDVSRTAGSARGAAEEFLVLPDGAEVGGRLRAITADGGLGGGRLKLTDVALLDVHAQWAMARQFELDGAITVLPKQPGTTHEHVLQGGSLAIRRQLMTRTAIALSGSASALQGIPGMALDGAAAVLHKHRLNEIVTFSLEGGVASTQVRATGAPDHPSLIEAAGHAAVLVRVPNGIWGGWMGAGYAVPIYHRGHDPVGLMPLDPQPRLDLQLGTAVQLAPRWDLMLELSLLDRGELSDPATRLPILDGGFDQIQLTVGVSRRLDLSRSSHRDPLRME